MQKHLIIAAAGLAASMLISSSVHAANPGTGFNVSVYYNVGSGPNSIAETQSNIASHGPADNTDTAATINYVGHGGDGIIGGGVAPPGYSSQPQDANNGVDHYAIVADGYVTGLSGPTSVTLGVNSDDGFGFYDNGSLVGSFDANRGPTNSAFTFQAQNGDHLQLIYWENGGGDEVELFEGTVSGNDANGNPIFASAQLVNGGSSSFGVNTTPEPGSLALLGLAGAIALRSRRSR